MNDPPPRATLLAGLLLWAAAAFAAAPREVLDIPADFYKNRKYSDLIGEGPKAAARGRRGQTEITVELKAPLEWMLGVLNVRLAWDKKGQPRVRTALVRQFKGSGRKARAAFRPPRAKKGDPAQQTYPVMLLAYDRSRYQTRLGVAVMKGTSSGPPVIRSGLGAKLWELPQGKSVLLEAKLDRARPWNLSVVFPGYAVPLKVFQGESAEIQASWDGKDPAGKPVFAGDYVLLLEVRTAPRGRPVAASTGLLRLGSQPKTAQGGAGAPPFASITPVSRTR